MENMLRFDSLLIHGGQEPGPAGSTSVPIVQSSAFAYNRAESLEDVFRGRAVGQVYTRLGNPTTEALEKRLALLEGGGAVIATASGMAAITTAVLTILRAGDEILSSSSLFGGTFSLFRDTLSNFGITSCFVDHSIWRVLKPPSMSAPGWCLWRRSAIPSWMCPMCLRWPASPMTPEFPSWSTPR